MSIREIHFLVVVNREDANLLGRLFCLAKAQRLQIGRVRTACVASRSAELDIVPGDFLVEFVDVSGVDPNVFLGDCSSIRRSLQASVLPTTDLAVRTSRYVSIRCDSIAKQNKELFLFLTNLLFFSK